MSSQPTGGSMRLVECAECERLRVEIERLRADYERGKHRIAAALTDLENAEQEIKSLRRQRNFARSDAGKGRQRHPNYETAKRLFEFWQQQCGRPHAKLGPARLKALLARLEDYPPREIAKAIKGASVGAFVNAEGRRFDDLELICRDETHLEKFIQCYEKAKGAA